MFLTQNLLPVIDEISGEFVIYKQDSAPAYMHARDQSSEMETSVFTLLHTYAVAWGQGATPHPL